MNTYDNNLKVRDALEIYFSRYHFKNGGYDLKWFRIKIGMIYIPLPNTKARVDAVKLHDIHHLVTGYEATLKGEVEIGAWELASGCGKYYAAWILNAGSFFYGIFFFPRTLFKAFMKGRQCITNLYHHVNYDDILLDTSLGELRQRIDTLSKNTSKDTFIFIYYAILILSCHFLFIFAMCKALEWLFHLIF